VHHRVSMRYLPFVGALTGLLAITLGGCGSGRVVNEGAGDAGDTRDAGSTGSNLDTCGDAGAGVTFQLQYDGVLCLGSVCGENWLTVSDSSGATVPFLPGLIQCSQCGQCEKQPDSCYLGCPIQPPAAGPLSIVWNGGVYPSSTCGNGTACTTSSCAAPGTYTATMCLHAASGDGGENACDFAQQPPANCKTFTFQWPPDRAETIAWSP
jgi:hypothetical protein